uniref:Uncharacterized protein n=1 Tax=Timema douglasi TaxID=61478 RepID=A0A7R8VBM0_TIMDO|nr:unnamed protein product [Timema douglasi]
MSGLDSGGDNKEAKVPIPCRPQKTFCVFVLEIPEDIPEEDIRHSLYKFHSVVEVSRLTKENQPAGSGGQQGSQSQSSGNPSSGRKSIVGNRIFDVVTSSGQRVRDMLPVFDAAGFSKIPPPTTKTIKPRNN